ncbi:MAG: hypothetical protein VX000_02595, partial [Myxococcota bacterium]|nr:hypothetical protein [Myxococcota bacterium]
PGILRAWRPGAGLLVWAGLGAVTARRASWRWLWLIAVGYLHALGPASPDAATAGTVDRPAGLLYALVPFYARLWWPQRASVLLTVGAAILAGHAAAWASENHGARLRRWALLGAVAIAAAALDGPMLQTRLQLPADPGAPIDAALYPGPAEAPGAVLTAVLAADDREAARHLLWAQAHHGRAISGGLGQHLPGHAPPGFDAWRGSRPLLSVLAAVGRGDAVRTSLAPDDIQLLLDDGFSHAVVDLSAYPASTAAAGAAAHACVLSAVFGPPQVKGPQGARWRVTVPGKPVEVACAYDPGARWRRGGPR